MKSYTTACYLQMMPSLTIKSIAVGKTIQIVFLHSLRLNHITSRTPSLISTKRNCMLWNPEPLRRIDLPNEGLLKLVAKYKKLSFSSGYEHYWIKVNASQQKGDMPFTVLLSRLKWSSFFMILPYMKQVIQEHMVIDGLFLSLHEVIIFLNTG